MKLSTAGLSVVLLTTCWCSALPPKETKDRVLHPQSMSKKEHEVDGEHNQDYDHDAFLGDEADTFDELSPEESKRRLGIIVDKIDKNKDNSVSEEELQHWIQYVQNRYVIEDTDRTWKTYKDEELTEGHLVWQSYLKHTFGYDVDPDEKEDHAAMVKRDKARFEAADLNKDGKLNKTEFSNFLHPEEASHMQDIVVQETIQDIDKDGDSLISLDEYIGDMWPNKEAEEPDWVKNERIQFDEYRDKNHDGKMNEQEVKEWIIPEDYDHSEAEAKHLIYESDSDKDGALTKEEILEHYEVFVGSQATDFGEALNRHDEF